MTVAAYSTDLVDISTAESATGWSEPGTWTGGAAPAQDNENFIQGSYANSKGFNSTGLGGMGFTIANTPMSTPTSVFFWHYWASPQTLESETNGGIRMIVGSSTAAFYGWKVGGKDTYTYGGWANYALDPSLTPDYTVGAPTTTKAFFGMAINNLNAVSKGSPFLCDVVRYGRTLQVINGDGSAAPGSYGNFASAAAKNDANDATNGYNRWGIFQDQGGSYLMKGLFLMGTASTAVDFRDANRVIFIQNTKKVDSSFNAFEERNASSNVSWTSISIQALGTVSRGTLVVTAGTFSATTCTFTDMSTSTFNSSSTLTTTTFRRCDQITGGGGTFNSCTITNSTAAVSLVLTNLNQATGCTFESDGSNHAVDLGTISSSTSMNWNNYLTGYAVSDGLGGNEAIKVDVAASQILTINVGTGYSTPSIYKTGSGSVSVVSGQVTTSVTVQKLSDGTDIAGARVLVWATDASNKFYNASVAITASGTTATVSHTGHGLVTGDYVIISGVTNDDDYNGVHQITKINNDSYSYTADDTLTSPATGTILAKWAIISGTTDDNGYIEDVRSFSNAQLIQGWVRKSPSASPFYQQGSITGEIDTGNGFSITVQLASDE